VPEEEVVEEEGEVVVKADGKPAPVAQEGPEEQVGVVEVRADQGTR
jgi:hypothetical protein